MVDEVKDAHGQCCYWCKEETGIHRWRQWSQTRTSIYRSRGIETIFLEDIPHAPSTSRQLICLFGCFGVFVIVWDRISYRRLVSSFWSPASELSECWDYIGACQFTNPYSLLNTSSCKNSHYQTIIMKFTRLQIWILIIASISKHKLWWKTQV